MSQSPVVNVALTDITTRRRLRRDTGDIAGLMDSMRRHGLLHPLVVTPDYRLVAGQRRLEAAKRLGWHSIACRVVTSEGAEQLLEIEIAENTARKAFTSDELADALLERDRLKHPPLLLRVWRGLRARWVRLVRRRR